MPDPVPDVDVLVVGAGPAGSATAISYKQAFPDLRVAMADKAAFPRDKACGDGLGPGVRAHLDWLGVDLSQIPHAKQIDMAEIHGPNGLSFKASLTLKDGTLASGITCKRKDLDRLLCLRAVEAGTVFHSGTRFVGSERLGDGNRVQFEDIVTKERFHLKCRLLVGADGASSRVRKAAGVATNPSHMTGIAIRAYAKLLDTDTADRIVLSFEDDLRPGYGWMFPFADGTANVGAGMVVSDHQATKPDLKEVLAVYLNTLADRGIPTGTPEGHRTHILPFGSKLPKLISGNIALVGDAASMINPWSGEGVVYALSAAQMLAEATGPALSKATDLNPGLIAYNGRFRREFQTHMRWNYLVHSLLRKERTTSMVLGGAAHDPRVCQIALNLMFGEGNPKTSDVLRVLKAGWKHLKQTDEIPAHAAV